MHRRTKNSSIEIFDKKEESGTREELQRPLCMSLCGRPWCHFVHCRLPRALLGATLKQQAATWAFVGWTMVSLFPPTQKVNKLGFMAFFCYGGDLFILIFGLGATLRSAVGLFLPFALRINPGNAWGTIWNGRD